MRTFGLPRWAAAIVWLLIVVFVVIIAAIIVHALGGFAWTVRIGYFRFLLGVS